MNKLWGISFLFAVLGLGLAAADGLLLDGRPVVTSSFGEYRPRRLHMGVDFSTGGRIGRPVRAFGDGSVTRIRCSPWGYGKAVYVKQTAGHTVVYGHLSDFREDLRAVVRATQHAHRTYTVDLTFRQGEYPVEKGEIIAWSGDTGAGPAHLHVEFRDETERPVDPRRAGLVWPADDFCPTVFGVVIYPADPDSRVNGTCFPYAAPAERITTGRYRIMPVAAAGRIYLGAAVLDLTPEGNRLGVWRAAVRQFDRELFEVRFDRLSYGHQSSGVLVFDPYTRIDDVPVMQLWRRPGNLLDIYSDSPGDGTVVLGEGVEAVTLEFEDFGGNVSVIEVPFCRDTGVWRPSRWAMVEGFFPRFRGLGVFTRASGSGEAEAQFSAVFDGSTVRLPLVAMDSGFGGWWLPPRPGAWIGSLSVNGIELDRIHLAVINPRESVRLETDHARFDFPVGALPPDTCVWVKRDGRPELSGLEALTETIQLLPDGAPVLKPFTLQLRVPTGAEKGPVAICRVSGTSADWLTTRRMGEWLVTESSAAGHFVVAVDRLAPAVKEWKTRQDPKRLHRPEIRASVSERGSGIASWDLYCGETWLLASYDPDKSEVVWERDEDLPGPLSSIRLVLVDRAGNRSEWNWQPVEALDPDRSEQGGVTQRKRNPAHE